MEATGLFDRHALCMSLGSVLRRTTTARRFGALSGCRGALEACESWPWVIFAAFVKNAAMEIADGGNLPGRGCKALRRLSFRANQV
jgi:hypothetical protein